MRTARIYLLVIGSLLLASCGPNKRGEDDEAVQQYGIDYATRQCEELLREGAPGLHFYTLNKARSTTEIMTNLRLAT